MLAFARKQDLKLEVVDIPQLVRGMGDFIRRSIGPNIDVRMRFADVLPGAATDPYQLETALLNLVVIPPLFARYTRVEQPERSPGVA